MSHCILKRRDSVGRTDPGHQSHRHRPRCRPAIEGLEGRALMSYGGTPDLSFGPSGAVVLPTVANQGYQALASATQPDGKVVVVGRLSSSTLGILGNIDLVAARYNSNGSIDTTFGTNGYFTSPSLDTVSTVLTPLDASARGVAIEPDGKILVVGNVGDGAKVVQLNSNGTLDPTFGSGGIVSLGFLNVLGAQLDYATSVALGPGGGIAVGGADDPTLGHDVAGVEMLNANGSINMSFGVGGVAVIPQASIGLLSFLPIVPLLSSGVFLPSSPVNVAAQADGKIVVVANASPTASAASSVIALTRFDANGALDTTYGVHGATLVSTESLFLSVNGATNATTLALQADGKLVIGGSIALGSVTTPHLLALRVGTNGLLDPAFGIGGANIPGGITPSYSSVGALAVQSDGKIVLADSVNSDFVRLDSNGLPDPTFGSDGTALPPVTRAGSVGVAILADGKILATQGGTAPGLVQLLGQGSTGDYDGDGISDPAIYITSTGSFAYKPSNGSIGATIPFGSAGTGLSLPAPGAYNGNGYSELAVYLPAQGAFAVRSVNGQTATITPFGTPGAGNSIPAPGDYDGSGKTEYAVYLPTVGAFAYRPANGGADVLVPFGTPGAGKSIPVPADYFGTGQDDIAVYLPNLGAYAIRNPVTGQDSIIPFGAPGAGNSIPVPGDYDGSGHAELAVYVPSAGALFYRPANGGPDVEEAFGIKGAGMTLPAPGDYDGSGKTEVAAYLPTLGLFAYRPANGGPDVIFGFGTPNQTIPFVSASATIATGVGGSGFAAPDDSASIPVEIPLTPDVLEWIAGPTAKKPAQAS